MGVPALRSSLCTSSGLASTGLHPSHLEGPELDAVLHVRPQNRGKNLLPQPAGDPASDVAQDVVGFLGSQHISPSHVELFIKQHPPCPPPQACFSILCPVSICDLSARPCNLPCTS